MRDEDKMIKKLKEHRNLVMLVEEIAELKGITVKATKGNDPNGDFIYEADKQKELIEILDVHLDDYKVKDEKESDEEEK